MTPEPTSTPARRTPRNDARANGTDRQPVENARKRRVIPLSAPPASDGPAQGTDPPRDNPQADGHGPARGYSWPPFEKGHTLSLIFGGYSGRTVAERAELVRHDLYAVAPWLEDQPSFAIAVERFLTVESRARIFAEHIERLAAEKGAGAIPTRTAEVANATARLANDLGAQLGLDPLSFAKIRALGASVSRDTAAADREALMAEGAAVRRAHEPRPVAVSDADVVPDSVSDERGDT
jgi:hypothetical protein